MWGSYQSSHSIIFLLPLAPLTGFHSFPVASLSKAGPGCPTQAAEESVSDMITAKFFWHISGDCTRYAILCNTSSDTSVWWELQNLASSSTFKRLKVLSEVGEYWGWRRKGFNFSTFYLWHLLGFWAFWFKMSPWLPVITMLQHFIRSQASFLLHKFLYLRMSPLEISCLTFSWDQIWFFPLSFHCIDDL